MFDYDELWEPSGNDPKCQPLSYDAKPDADQILVVARHAIQGNQIKVLLPKRAKFKHVKKALARRLKQPEIFAKAQLLDKIHGLYTAYRDRDPVGDVKEVLVLGVDFTLTAGSRLAAVLSDSEITEEEPSWVTVEHVGDKRHSSALEAQATAPTSEPQQNTRQAPKQAAKRNSRRHPQVNSVGQLFSGDQASSYQLPWAGGSGPRRMQRQDAPAQAQGLAPVLAADKGADVPQLTKAEAMNLQLELYERYTEADFQEELRFLYREADSMPRLEWTRARQELFFQVQCQVLPRYGFEESEAGVYKMIAAMGPFIRDSDFIELAEKVNEAVGVNNPSEKWGKLQQACEKWEFADNPRAGKPR